MKPEMRPVTLPTHAKGDMTRDIIAIVGSVSFMCPTGLAIARRVIVAELTGRVPDLVVSGGADGIDKLAVAIAEELGIPALECPAKDRSWNGANGFRARNMKISNLCTRAMRISCSRSKTYGSGFTVDRAETLYHRSVRRIEIHPDGTMDDKGWTIPPAAQEELPI